MTKVLVQCFTDHMLCLKMSSGLVRIREPSGAEGRPLVLFNLEDNLLKSFASLATEELLSFCIYSVKMQEEIIHLTQSFDSASVDNKTAVYCIFFFS